MTQLRVVDYRSHNVSAIFWSFHEIQESTFAWAKGVIVYCGCWASRAGAQAREDMFVASLGKFIKVNPIIIIKKDVDKPHLLVKEEECKENKNDDEGEDDFMSPHCLVATWGSICMEATAIQSFMIDDERWNTTIGDAYKEPHKGAGRGCSHRDVGCLHETEGWQAKLVLKYIQIIGCHSIMNNNEEEDFFQLKRLRSKDGTSGSNTFVELNIIIKPKKMETINDYNAK